jgi:hypothetical protein
LEIEVETPSGFNNADVGVVRDNTKQLKSNPGSKLLNLWRRTSEGGFVLASGLVERLPR